MPETVRLQNGQGAEVTVPEWAGDTPTPEQWVDWFLIQSREAQEQIAMFHLATDHALVQVRRALSALEWSWDDPSAAAAN